MGWLDTVLGSVLNFGIGALGQELFGTDTPSVEDQMFGQMAAKTAEGMLKGNTETALADEKKRKAALAQHLEIPQIPAPAPPGMRDTSYKPWLTGQTKSWEE